jgi:uncharacterized protein YneF (UPF0154 family)
MRPLRRLHIFLHRSILLVLCLLTGNALDSWIQHMQLLPQLTAVPPTNNAAIQATIDSAHLSAHATTTKLSIQPTISTTISPAVYPTFTPPS